MKEWKEKGEDSVMEWRGYDQGGRTVVRDPHAPDKTRLTSTCRSADDSNLP